VLQSERILLSIAALVCLTFVFSLRDTAPRQVVRAQIEPPPVPESVTDRPGRLVAIIESEAGAPVAGASVRVLSLEDERAYLAGAASTDAAGRAEVTSLPKGETWILAEREGFARASTRLVVDDAPRDVKMRLRPASSLRVAVVDDGGAAVPDAWVEARTGDPLPFVTRGDAKGHATIARLGPPPWNVRIKAPGYEMAAQTLTRASADVVKITLRKLGFFDVSTVDPDGKPVASATVLVAGSGLWPARKVESGADGRVKIADLPRGIYDLRATHGDRVSQAEMGIALGRGESKSVTLVLVAGRRVSVRVTDGDDADAAPVPGASLVLAEGGLSSFPLEATTDARGGAILGPIAPGDAYLSADAAGFVPRTGIAVPAGAAPLVRVGLVRGATLRGDVVDARGYPVDGASVEVVGSAPSGEPIDESPERMAFRAAHFSWALAGPRKLVPSGELGIMPGPLPAVPHTGAIDASFLRGHGAKPPPEPWVTRDDGSFRAFPVPPGRVRAIVRHPSYTEGASELVSLASGGETRVRVVLHGGGALEGRVLDDRKNPLAGVRVEMAAIKGSLERTTTTADDGTFAFAAVPGDVVISASRPDAQDDVALRTNVSLKEGEKKEIELVLPAAREALTVAVVDERGTPLDGAQILVLSLLPDAPLRRTLFTSRDGRAVFKDAVGLPLRVSVSRRGRAPEVREIDSAPQELRFELQGGVTAQGSVTARGGRDPLDGADVTLYTASGSLHARTDRAGTFHFDDVPPGPARIVASHAGYARDERTVQIEAGARADRPASLGAIDLEEGGSVEGEVVDARGEAVAGARVAEGTVPTYVPTGKPPQGVVLTNRRGEFKIEDLRDGDVVLEAYAPDVGRGRATSRISKGRATRGVRIAIAPLSETEAHDSTATGGVAVTFDETGASGASILSIAEGSEAERAGLQPGDRIVSIDGEPIASPSEARARLNGPVGDDVVLDVARGDVTQKLRVARERVHR
jgi:protocatechuate 3,4-dioxygenase beta subunit